MRLTRPLVTIALTGAFTLAPAAALHAQTPAATIDRAARAFQESGSLRATFEQTLVNPLTGNTSKSTGELALARPNKLSLKFAGAGDRVVSDGKWLWVYLPSSMPGQVLKMPATSSSSVGLDVVGDVLNSPRAKFDVADAGTATIDGHATHAVTLTPKRETQGVSKVQVWVDDATGSVRQLLLTQDTGLERTWRMTTWTPNASVSKSTFSFDVPKGAKVVDPRALKGAS